AAFLKHRPLDATVRLAYRPAWGHDAHSHAPLCRLPANSLSFPQTALPVSCKTTGRCAILSLATSRYSGPRPSKSQPAMLDTMLLRGSAAGCCNAPTVLASTWSN